MATNVLLLQNVRSHCLPVPWCKKTRVHLGMAAAPMTCGKMTGLLGSHCFMSLRFCPLRTLSSKKISKITMLFILRLVKIAGITTSRVFFVHLLRAQESSAKLTNQRVSYAFTSSPFSFHARHILPTSRVNIWKITPQPPKNCYKRFFN